MFHQVVYVGRFPLFLIDDECFNTKLNYKNDDSEDCNRGTCITNLQAVNVMIANRQIKVDKN